MATPKPEKRGMDDRPQSDLWRALERIERKVNYIGEGIMAATAFAVGYAFYLGHAEWGHGIALAIGIGVGIVLFLVYRWRFLKP